jgi:hypothetical protein
MFSLQNTTRKECRNLVYIDVHLVASIKGTYKVRNEIETKRNEINENETKRNETKRNQRKRNKNIMFSLQNTTRKECRNLVYIH